MVMAGKCHACGAPRGCTGYIPPVQLQPLPVRHVGWAVVDKTKQVIIHRIRGVELVADQLAERMRREHGGEWHVISVYAFKE